MVGWEATGNAGELAGEKRAMDSIMGDGVLLCCLFHLPVPPI